MNITRKDKEERLKRLALLEIRPIPNTINLHDEDNKITEAAKLKILKYYYKVANIYAEWIEEIDALCDMVYDGEYTEGTLVYDVMSGFNCANIQDKIDAIYREYLFDGDEAGNIKVEYEKRKLKSDQMKIRAFRLTSYYEHYNHKSLLKSAIRELSWIKHCIKGDEEKYPEVAEAETLLKKTVVNISFSDSIESLKRVVFDVYVTVFYSGIRWHNHQRSLAK